MLEAALQQFYETTPAPPEIMLPVDVEDAEALETWLSERAGRKVRSLVPQRGDKKGLRGARDAQRGAGLPTALQRRDDRGNYEALETLRRVLRLPALPRRIDCFDISTIQGSDTVASMVVCEDGRMKKGGIPEVPHRAEPWSPTDSATSPCDADKFLDDFAAMQQVVERRYRRVLEDGGPFPDLIVIDGGKGQLTAAYEALESLGLANLVAVGLAKKEELIFTRDSASRLPWRATTPALLLLQRIRDEAHRFAITFHRATRSKRDLRPSWTACPASARGAGAAAAAVRQPVRRPARHARGARNRRGRESGATRCCATFRVDDCGSRLPG